VLALAGPAGAARLCGGNTGFTKHLDSARCPESKDVPFMTMASPIAEIVLIGGIGSDFESSITPTACEPPTPEPHLMQMTSTTITTRKMITRVMHTRMEVISNCTRLGVEKQPALGRGHVTSSDLPPLLSSSAEILDASYDAVADVVGAQFTEAEIVAALRACEYAPPAAIAHLLDSKQKAAAAGGKGKPSGGAAAAGGGKGAAAGGKGAPGTPAKQAPAAAKGAAAGTPSKAAAAAAPVHAASSSPAPSAGHGRAASAASSAGFHPTAAAAGSGGAGAAAAAAAAAAPLPLPPIPEEVRRAYEHEDRPRLSVVTIGHVDAGKSTLMGHLLYDLGVVSARQLHRFAREARDMGKASFAFAWVLDEEGAERERGVTMDVGTNAFETPTRCFTLLDAPGHRDFVPNTITAISQADVAVLVLDASPGEYEMSMEGGGQAKEHALLARNFGITQLVVAINKMDGPRVRWSRERFDGIVASVTPLLTGMGFKREGLTFVPVSGLTGINLVRSPAEVAAAGGGGAVSRQSTTSEGSAPEHASWAATSGAGAAAAADAASAASAGRGAGARGTAAGVAADSAAAGSAALHRNASERHRESRALHSHSHDHDDSGGGVWGSRGREGEELDPDMADMLEGLGLSRQEIAAAAASKKQQHQAAAHAGAGAGAEAGPVTSWAVEGAAAAGPREGGAEGLSRLPTASSADTASSAGSGAASAARGAAAGAAAAAAAGGGGHVMARQSSFDAAAVDSDISAMLLSADALRPEEVGRLSEWYTGPTLLQALEAVRAPPRLLDRPLRLCVADVYRSPVAGLTVAGRIEGGWLVPHTKLVVVPGASCCCRGRVETTVAGTGCSVTGGGTGAVERCSGGVQAGRRGLLAEPGQRRALLDCSHHRLQSVVHFRSPHPHTVDCAPTPSTPHP